MKTHRQNYVRGLTLSLAFSFAAAAQAQTIGINSANDTYSENFDSLSGSVTANNAAPADVTWNNGTTINGWYAINNGVVPANYRVTGGASLVVSDNGAIGSMGSSAERAFGIQAGVGDTIRIGAVFSNTSGATFSGFSIGYTAEQWRAVNTANDTLSELRVDYQVFSSGNGSITAATGWTSLSSLDFTAFNVSSGPLNGNLPANQQVFAPFDVTGITWSADEELAIRFSIISPSGAAVPGADFQRDMIGVDNFSLVAIPEPQFFGALVGALALGLVIAVRRRARR